MSKNRVYGEDVVVTLYNENYISALISDFDEIRNESQVQNKQFKSISKRVHQNQSYNSGWSFTLVRSKRDNYLQTLVDFNNWCIQRGLTPPKFTVEVIANFTYPVTTINPKDEFSQKSKDAFNKFVGITSAFKNEYNKYINVAQNIGGKIASPQQLSALYNINAQATNVNNLINTAFNGWQSFNGLRDALLPPFQEKYVYYNCGIKSYSEGHKPKENSIEQIEFNSSYRVNLGDENPYTDEYANLLWKNMIDGISKNLEAKDKDNQSFIYKDIKYQSDYERLIQQHLDQAKVLRENG